MNGRALRGVVEGYVTAAHVLVWMLFAVPVSASTILVGAGVRNGDFNEDASATDSRAFDVTPIWWNIGTGDQAVEATRANQDFDGTRNAVLTTNPNRIHAQNTQHDIQEGDVFTVRFMWRDAFQWDANLDRVVVRLYVTDNDLIGGTRTILANIDSGFSSADATYEEVVGFSAPAGASFDGKRLFVMLDTSRETASAPHAFARLDNLVIIANQTIDEIPIGGVVRNGNFNTTTSEIDSGSFGQTADWQNIGTGDEDIQATRNAPSGALYDGTRNAVISSNPDRIHGQNTGYSIKQGDVFQISYVWRDGVDFNHATDQIKVRLFVTHNDIIGGTPTELAVFDSGLSRQSQAWQFAYGVSSPAGAAFDGKTLFLSIDMKDSGGNRFARVDNFQLVINPNTLLIPMFGLWGLAALIGLVAMIGWWKLSRTRATVV